MGVAVATFAAAALVAATVLLAVVVARSSLSSLAWGASGAVCVRRFGRPTVSFCWTVSSVRSSGSPMGPKLSMRISNWRMLAGVICVYLECPYHVVHIVLCLRRL